MILLSILLLVIVLYLFETRHKSPAPPAEICKHCGQPVADEDLLCSHCRELVRNHCPACGKSKSAACHFCPWCGAEQNKEHHHA